MLLAGFDRLRVLNVRELRTHWGRALASFAVVAVSAALLVAVLGVSGSINGSIDRLAASIGGDADLEVSGITEDGFAQTLFDDVGRVGEVAAAVPLTRSSIQVRGERALLLGVGPNASELHSDLQSAVQDQLRDGSALTSAPDGVLVGPNMGLSTGDRIDVGSGQVTVAVVVAGDAAHRLNDGHFVMAPLPLAQRLSGREDRLDSMLVFGKPGVDAAALRGAVSRSVDGRAVVATPSLRAAQASSSFAILQAMTLLAASVSLVVAAFLTYNAISLAIAQRRPAISTMRALGGRRRTIVSDLLTEAALVGFIGGATGSVAGVIIGHLAIDDLPPTMVQSLEARIEFVLAPWVVPLAIAAGTFASVAAAALAARQVHAVAPIEALGSGSAGPATTSRRLRVGCGVAGVALLAVTVGVVTADLGQAVVASIALAFVAAAALCFALSTPIIRVAAAVARCFGAPGALGATAIERAPQRFWVAMMTVLTAVVTTVAVTGATRDAIDATVASFSSVADTDIWVSSAGASDYSSALLPGDTEAVVRAIPGVERIVADQMAYATVLDTRVMLLGLAPGSHRNIVAALPGETRRALRAGSGVVLSRDLGHALDVTEGQDVTLQTPTGPHEVRVVALVPYFSGMTGTVAMDLDTMRAWYQRPGASDLEIAVTRGADPAAVRDAIRKAVAPTVFVYSGTEALRGVSSALDQVVEIITAIAWIVVVVSAVTLLNMLMLSVLDRRRELGALRAIGAGRRFTVAAVLAEAAGVGVVGAALGLVIGLAIQYLASLALTNVLSIDVAFQLSPWTVVVAIGALGVCLLGAVPPAVRAARLNIIRAIGAD